MVRTHDIPTACADKSSAKMIKRFHFRFKGKKHLLHRKRATSLQTSRPLHSKTLYLIGNGIYTYIQLLINLCAYGKINTFIAGSLNNWYRELFIHSQLRSVCDPLCMYP